LRKLGELNALGPFPQGELPWRVLDDVTQVVLPLRLEAVVEDLCFGNFVPRPVKIDRLWLVRVPHRLGGVDAMLGPALGQTTNRRSMSAVDLEGHEIITTDANRPGRVDMSNDAPLEFEGRIGGIISVSLVDLAIFVDAAWNVG